MYSEIANLRAEKTAEGLFQTRLGTRLEVLTADGKSVWQREELEIVDTCRRRRSDFFIAQRVTLPPTLPAGDYVLRASNRMTHAQHVVWSMPGTDMEVRTWQEKSSRMNYGR